MMKNNEVIADQNSGITRRLWHIQHTTVLERSIEVGFSLILSIYKVDVGEIFCQVCQKLNYITPLKTA